MKRLILASVCVLFVAGTALAAPIYVTPENPDPQIAISINAVGTPP
jgi:hypothetical protein